MHRILAALALLGAPALPVAKAEPDTSLATQAQLDKLDRDIDAVGGGDCDCGTVALAATSTLKPEGKARYGIENLRDHKLKTAWCEGVPGFGQGQQLTLSLDRDTGHPTWNGVVRVFNGYQAGEKVWKKNGRVKALRVSLDGKPLARVELADVQGAQTFSLAEQLQGQDTRGTKVVFEILEVYSDGATAQDTCLSEFELDSCCP